MVKNILILFFATYVTSDTVTFTPAEQHLYLSSNFTPQLSKPASDEMIISGYREFASQDHGVFYFHFDSATIRPEDKKSILVQKAIKRGMEILEQVSCVRFYEGIVKNLDQSIGIVYGGDGNDCHVMSDSEGPMKMVMGFDCIAPSTIFHELFHLLGFIHEHARTDRDKYVHIIDHDGQNEIRGMKNMFPFSFTSVMLYPSDPHAMVAQPNYRDVYWPKQDDLFLSRRDVVALNTLYKCPKFPKSDEFEKIVDRVGSDHKRLSKMNVLDQKLFSIPQSAFVDNSIDWRSRRNQQQENFERSVRLMA